MRVYPKDSYLVFIFFSEKKSKKVLLCLYFRCKLKQWSSYFILKDFKSHTPEISDDFCFFIFQVNKK